MFFLVLFLLEFVQGKIYERCELALELKHVHKVAEDQVATWVCIAERESQYNSSAVGNPNADGSRDHGIFQINDRYWCSPPGKGWACGLSCSKLEDDDINDDFICAKRIYKEHKLLSGNGFNAWAVYKPFCKGPLIEKYVKDCFGNVSEDSYLTSTRPSGKKFTKKLYPWLLPNPSASIRSQTPSTTRDKGSAASEAVAPRRCSTSTAAGSSKDRTTQQLDSTTIKATDIPGSDPFGVKTVTPGSNVPDEKYLKTKWDIFRNKGTPSSTENGILASSRTDAAKEVSSVS